MKLYNISLIVFSVLISLPNTVYGNIGDTIEKAKSRIAYYTQKYGAVDPMFKTDDSGKVIWECWAAPPEGWSKKEALNFAKSLLPKSLINEKPRKLNEDGAEVPYIYSDGTKIILLEFSSKYYSAEVRIKSYKGPGC